MSGRKPKEKTVTLGSKVHDGEIVFCVAYIFACFNGTFIHGTDISGRVTFMHNIGGMKVQADRNESSPYAATVVAQDVMQRCKELGIYALHIKLRVKGRNKTKTQVPSAQSTLARSGMKTGSIAFSYSIGDLWKKMKKMII